MFDHSPPFGHALANTKASTPSPTTSLPADSRRRYALQYLGKFDYPVELRTLAAYVAAALTAVPIETVSDDERERIAIRLHHIDIPKLATEGVVDYDPESRMAVYTDTANCTERYAASDRSHRSA